jgi:hypothetical protein
MGMGQMGQEIERTTFGTIIPRKSQVKNLRRFPPIVSWRTARIGVTCDSIMSVTIQLDLPDGLVRQAREMGLLESKRLADLLADEVRRPIAGQELKTVLDKIRSAPGESQTMDEINSEIKASRAERRAREAGH